MDMSVEETTNLLDQPGNPSNTEVPMLDERERDLPAMKHSLLVKDAKIQIFVVVEDFRAAYYVSTLLLLALGFVLTKLYVDIDHTAIIADVYGGTNVCTYLDYPPSTYVLPMVWIVPLLSILLHTLMSGFRIWISWREEKICRNSMVLLIFSLMYVAASAIWFTTIFAVQPDRKVPVTMIIHSLPYGNIKLSNWVLHIVVTWFGAKVAWKGLDLPGWFVRASTVHCVLLCFVTAASNVFIANALGDMGEHDLEGKGLWWDVRNPISVAMVEIVVNLGGLVLGIILPLIQSIWLVRLRTQTDLLVFTLEDKHIH